MNKIHQHIANQRNDFLHKQSDAITKRYDVICVETLNMRAISNKKFHNGKATMDNGYGMFLNMVNCLAIHCRVVDHCKDLIDQQISVPPHSRMERT